MDNAVFESRALELFYKTSERVTAPLAASHVGCSVDQAWHALHAMVSSGVLVVEADGATFQMPGRPAPTGEPLSWAQGTSPSLHVAAPAYAQDQRQLAGGLALAAALLLCVGLFTKGWWTASSGFGSVEIGLTGFQACAGNDCQEGSLDQSEKTGWSTLGILTLVAGLAAAGSLLVVGGSLSSRRTPRTAPKWLRAAPIAVMAMGFCFLAATPDTQGASVGYSVFLTFGGAALGLGAIHLLAKIQRLEAGWGWGAMQVAPCPRCAAAMMWVGQYQRWHCARCQQYA